jgi:co-chaperonin GroES (HSP10)
MKVSPLHDRVLVVGEGARKVGELTPMAVKAGDRFSSASGPAPSCGSRRKTT